MKVGPHARTKRARRHPSHQKPPIFNSSAPEGRGECAPSRSKDPIGPAVSNRLNRRQRRQQRLDWLATVCHLPDRSLKGDVPKPHANPANARHPLRLLCCLLFSSELFQLSDCAAAGQKPVAFGHALAPSLGAASVSLYTGVHFGTPWYTKNENSEGHRRSKRFARGNRQKT